MCSVRCVHMCIYVICTCISFFLTYIYLADICVGCLLCTRHYSRFWIFSSDDRSDGTSSKGTCYLVERQASIHQSIRNMKE